MHMNNIQCFLTNYKYYEPVLNSYNNVIKKGKKRT